jgi:hypothetical protein
MLSLSGAGAVACSRGSEPHERGGDRLEGLVPSTEAEDRLGRDVGALERHGNS